MYEHTATNDLFKWLTCLCNLSFWRWEVDMTIIFASWSNIKLLVRVLSVLCQSFWFNFIQIIGQFQHLRVRIFILLLLISFCGFFEYHPWDISIREKSIISLKIAEVLVHDQMTPLLWDCACRVHYGWGTQFTSCTRYQRKEGNIFSFPVWWHVSMT